jgi:hypothetical protein
MNGNPNVDDMNVLYLEYVGERFAALNRDLMRQRGHAPAWRRCARRPTTHRPLGRRTPHRTGRRAATRTVAASGGGDGNGDGDGDDNGTPAPPAEDPDNNPGGDGGEHGDDDFTAAPTTAEAWTSLQDLPVYLTVPQTARLLQKSEKAIYHMAERGLLPGAIRFGRTLLVDRDILLRSLREGRAPSPERR